MHREAKYFLVDIIYTTADTYAVGDL